MKKMSIYYLLIIVIVFIVFVVFGVLKVSVRSHVKILDSYGKNVLDADTENGVLSNQSQREEVLDVVENYIITNRSQLGIVSYERTDTSLVVTFRLGVSYVFSPMIEGQY